MDVQDELTEAFTTATVETFWEMLGVGVTASRSVRVPSGEGYEGVTAVIRFTSGVSGGFAMSFPGQTAAAVARRMLGAAMPHPDRAMVQDCACEAANVVAGRAKLLLHGRPSHFYFSPPDTTGGATPDRLTVVFDSEIGNFSLHLCVS